MDDTKDVCEFMGITCDERGNVVKIGLSNSSLSGTIAEEIGFLQFLEELDLSNNDLSGFLPSDLRWADLTKLDISGNRIRGVVPPLLCLMEGINGNCDKIACPSGTYNARGSYQEEKCLECFDGSPFIGQTSCSQKLDPHSIIGEIEIGSVVVIKSAENLDDSTKLGPGIALAALGIALLICCMLRRGRQWKQKRNQGDGKQSKVLHLVAEKTGGKYYNQKEAHVPIDDHDCNSDSSSTGDSEEVGDDDEALWWAIQRYGEDHDVVRLLRMCNAHEDGVTT
jgi:hypothetical protein